MSLYMGPLYIIATATEDHAGDLVREVSRLRAEGWVYHGGLLAVNRHGGSGNIMMFQPMVWPIGLYLAEGTVTTTAETEQRVARALKGTP